jgi:hypothetical protein
MMKHETITQSTEALAKAVASILASGGDARELAQGFSDFTRHLESFDANTDVAKSAYGLAKGVAAIINGNADEGDKEFALANAFAQFERDLGIGKKGAQRHIVFDKIFDGIIAKAKVDDLDDDDDDDDDDDGDRENDDRRRAR